MPAVYGVVAYWEFKSKPKKSFSDKWELIESYAVDCDGYPITPPKNTSGGGDRHEFMKWLQINEDFDSRPIMGRAVTMWSVESGVQLLGFNPPEWVSWLSPSFYEEVIKNKDWQKYIADAHVLWLKTAKEASKYLTFKESP